MLESLHKLLKQEPFEPFKIILTSGREYDVMHDLAIAISPRTVFYYYPKSERHAFFPLKEISAIETLDHKTV
ncbi:MAG: hypothetical protein FWD61_16380 [Phycisphaerales bacterium]|nr:hypothetical protein [Phycisphaerales bacterium]